MKHLLLLFAGILIAVHTSTGQQNLFINEIIARNANGEMDNFFQREDWVEIYNSGGLTNLAGYYLSDDPALLTKWEVPSNDPTVTFVLPNSFIIFWCDNDPQQGANHTNFKLSGDGEPVFLVAPDGVTIIDSVTFPPMAQDISYGRACDGCPEWQYFNNVTFKAPNIEIQPTPQLLFINELQSQNTNFIDFWHSEYDPWLEIFNPNNFQVNLAGYYLGTTDNPLAWQIPANDPQNTAIRANSFKLFWCDNEPEEGSLHASISLSPAGGNVILTAPDGVTTTDSYAYPGIAPGISYGRQSDGAPASVMFNQPTPRVTNTLVFIQPELLYINELLASNATDTTDHTGSHEDWFELYNPNSYPVNLAGYYISDNPDNPTKWRVPISFPDSVTIPAQGWMLFWADDDEIEGVHHSGFRLSAAGEFLMVSSPDGFSIADHISWGPIPVDTSYGRTPDGGAQWVLFSKTTPNASNADGIVHIETLREAIEPWSVFPNPASGTVRLSRASALRVYNASGQLHALTPRTFDLDVSGWPDGMYIMVSDDGAVFRLIKN